MVWVVVPEGLMVHGERRWVLGEAHGAVRRVCGG